LTFYRLPIKRPLVENIFISARIFVAIWHMATW
jgi:hypothetical protein